MDSENKSEVIVEVGAEGASVALYGFRTQRRWSFSREATSWTPVPINDEWVQNRSSVVGTWEAALQLIDRYPWPKLRPICIHPKFRRQIWCAVRERLQNDTETSEAALERWRGLCRRTDDFNSLLEEHLVAWRRQNISNQESGTYEGVPYPWILDRSDWKEGLWHEIRVSLPNYLEEYNIVKHRDVHNLKSSWISCANLYFPFRENRGRALLAEFLRTKVSPQIQDVEKIELEYVENDESVNPQSLLGESARGMRGAHQTSPDVAFIVKTVHGRGLILTESKLAEHHFYMCSGRKMSAENPEPGYCLDWATLRADSDHVRT